VVDVVVARVVVDVHGGARVPVRRAGSKRPGRCWPSPAGADWTLPAIRLADAGAGREGQHETTDSVRVKVNVDKLGAFGEPMALAWPRGRVEKMLPKINVPDLLFEVHLDRVPAFPAPVRP
jgi:hypothetical protein